MESPTPERPNAPTPSGSPNVARAGGIMVASLLLSRVLGLVRDMVMSGKFGADASVDAYGLAFMVPDLLFFLIAGGALSSAFIPVFSEYLHTNREREAWHVFSVVTTVMSAIVIGFVTLAWIFAEPLTLLLAAGKLKNSPETIPLIVEMTRIVLPAQFAFFIGGLMFGTLYARQVFAVPGLGPNVYNLGIIFGAVALSSFFTPGIVGMSWGALVGALVGNLVIPFFVMRRMDSRFRVSFDVRHEGVRKVFRLMLPVVLGLSLPGVYGLITQYFGAFYEVGVNSWLRYANLLMQAPLGVFGQSLAIAVFPALTQFFAQERMDLYRAQLTSTMRTVLYLSVPVSALMVVASPQIVAAVYQHGKFTPEDTAQVARLLQWYGVGVWAWCLHPVLMRGFFALQSSVTPIVLGTATTVVFVGLILLLDRAGLGSMSLPIASSASAVFLVILLSAAVNRKVGGLDVRSILVTLGKSLIGAAFFAGATWLVLQTPLASMGRQNKLTSVLLLMLLCVPGAWLYYFVTKALGMPETGYVSRAMERLHRKREGR